MICFPSKVGVAWVFLRISLRLHPWEIPWKTQATPPSDGKHITFLTRMEGGDEVKELEAMERLCHHSVVELCEWFFRNRKNLSINFSEGNVQYEYTVQYLYQNR